MKIEVTQREQDLLVHLRSLAHKNRGELVVLKLAIILKDSDVFSWAELQSCSFGRSDRVHDLVGFLLGIPDETVHVDIIGKA